MIERLMNVFTADPDIASWRLIMAGGKQLEQGCTQIYFRYGGRIKTIFWRAGAAPETAEDLMHDVMVKLIRHCRQFSPDQNFRRWLFAIARNTLVDHLRKRDEQAASGATGVAVSASEREALASFGLRDCVQHAMREFEMEHPERAEILTQYIIEGMSSKALAGLLGRSDGATREYLRQCRLKLTPYLQKCRVFLSGDEP